MQKLNSTQSIMDLLLTRRSVVAANMKFPGPDDNELKEILSAGLRVPDHGKLCPWRVQVLGKESRQKLVDLQTALFYQERANDSSKKIELLNKITLNSPTLLVVTACANPDKYAKVPLLEQQLSGGALCQNILVASHAMGYVAQWLTNWPAYHVEIKRLLGHDAEVDILGFIHIGTAHAAPSERDRPDFQERVSFLD